MHNEQITANAVSFWQP